MIQHLQRVAHDLQGPFDWRRCVTLICAGAISAAAMAPLFLWPVLFLTMPVLVWSVGVDHDRLAQRLRRGFVAGWLFGFGYFLAGLYWIAYPFLVEAEKFAWLLPVAVAALPAGLALFFGLAAAIATGIGGGQSARIASLAFGFGAVEGLRCWVFTGFPWNMLGYALAPPGPMIHAAGLLGGVALSAVLVVVVTPLVWVTCGLRALRNPLMLSAGLLALLVGYGLWERAAPEQPGNGAAIRIVQPNIAQKDKLDAAKIRVNMEQLLDMSRRRADGRVDDGDGAGVIIWPESVFRFIVMEEPLALAAIAGLVDDGQSLITGAMRLERGTGGQNDFRVWNSVFVFNGDATRVSVYDKIHLVPFGEYLPKQNLLEAIGLQQLTRIRGGFTSGTPAQKFEIPKLPGVLPLICYEIAFPFEVLRQIERNGDQPRWLLNVTNDAWFGTSSGPYQHLHQTQLRAAETGLPVVRAANTGVSALIDGRGIIRQSLPLNTQGILDVRLPMRRRKPPFARAPFLITSAVLSLCLITAVAFRLRAGQVAAHERRTP